MTNPAQPVGREGATGNPPITIVVVDDHAVIRQALRLLLQSQPEVEVIGDAENGRDAIGMIEALRPDVVLMDVVMPGLNGIEATRHIRRLAQSSRVVMLSGFVDEDQLVDALRAGASGYLLKSSDVSELMLAIQTVHRGNTYYSSQLSQGYDLQEIAFQAHRRGRRIGVEMLTGREREVLQLIAEGHTNQHVADELGISIKTVEAHKAHMMGKLHVRNRTDLIRYALQRGIVRLESAAVGEEALAEQQVGDFIIPEPKRRRGLAG